MRKNVVCWSMGLSGLFLIGLYLLRLHYVQDYSDPVSFVVRAIDWGAGGDGADRAPLYPIILYGLMRFLGRDWVFIANIPFVLLLLVMLGLCTRAFFADHCRWPNWVRSAAVLFPGAVFFMVRYGLLQQLVNPYREPIALSLMLAVAYLFLKGWRGGRGRAILLGGLAGLLLGGATSIRETSLLLILPLGLWGLREIWARRKIPFGFVLVFGLGLLVGLLPLLIKNHQFSGSSLVPAYSAGHVSHYAETGSWDIPIPGMRIAYFRDVAPRVVINTLRLYRPIGFIFFGLGVLFAMQRRNWDVLFLYVPAFLVYFLFHSFYRQYMARYVLTAEVFAVPVLTYGIIESWRWLEDRLRVVLLDSMPVLRRTVGMYLAILYVLFLLPPMLRGNARTKVWNLPAIRSEIKAHIEEPAIFMGHRHFCFRMSWLLDQPYYEYTLRFQRDRKHFAGFAFDTRLAAQGRDTIERFAEGNYYMNASTFALASNWLQRDPIFDFADLSVPFERYGRPLSGNLYRVRLWQQNQTVLRSEQVRPGQAVLMLDMRRPWDYPGRTFLQGTEPSLSAIRHELTNAVQFVELPEQDIASPFTFTIASDAPVPIAPSWQLIGLNDDILMSFGMAAQHWAWNWGSDALFPNRFVPYDAGQLYDAADIRLPVFADRDMDVYAEVRVEFLQQHPFWREDQHTVQITSPVWTDSWLLPGPRQQRRYVIPLGRGAGRLTEVPLMLQTSLPSREEQNTPAFNRRVSRNAIVKLYDVRVFSHRPSTQLPAVLDVGRDDVHAVGGGFYDPERSGAHTGRWTSGMAHLRMRRFTPIPERVRVSILPLRPTAFASDLIFTFNGKPVAADIVDVEHVGDVHVYAFPVDPDPFDYDGDWLTLRIETKTWNPAQEGIARDHRDLGVFVTGVEFR